MEALSKLSPANIGQLFSPLPQEFPSPDYDGLEFRYGKLTFRPAMFITEGILLGMAVLYLIISLVGSSLNSKRVTSWVKAHQGIYDAQFARPGTTNLLNDGPTDSMIFSTGRRAVAYLQTIFSLFPRHDFIQFAYEFGWSLFYLEYSREDHLLLDFKLSNTSNPAYVWALIDRHHIKNLRKERFDLTYFTKTSENGTIPKTTILMHESVEVTDLITKSAPGAKVLAELSNPAVAKYFRALVVTDQPEKRPTKGPIPAEKKERHLIISLTLPPPSESAVTVPLVQAVLDLIDFLDAKTSLRDEIVRKLAKTRVELDALLMKEFSEPTAEEKEEAEEAKRVAKKKAEEEKFALMTPDQQRKYEEKERKKALRKGQGKMVYK